jgi:2-polyprenyl-3-methyl-5-hydroxy-6-metoxy-1,4-benzoquinol methylase
MTHSVNVLDEVYRDREQFIHLEKDPYLSPNIVHRKIFWQRIRVAQLLIARYCNLRHDVLDFGTNQGVIVPFLVQHFHTVNSVELRSVREKDDQIAEITRMLEHLSLPTRGLNFIDIEPDDQQLKMLDDDSQDCIVATDVLEHVPKLPMLLDTFERILRSGGVIIVSIPLEHPGYKLGVWLNDLFFGMGIDRSFHVNSARHIDRLVRERFRLVTTRSLWTFFRLYVLTLK